MQQGEAMRFDGRLKAWNDERGFGFIEPDQGGQEIFVHIKAYRSIRERPSIGQRVSFEVEIGPQGKKRARAVEPQRPASPVRQARGHGSAQWGTVSFFAIPAFLCVYMGVAVLWGVSSWVAAWYLGASVVCAATYAADKSAARSGAWRVKESTLIGLGLVGGWPGAILAQQGLRHKSSKAAFRSNFWFSVMVNVAAFVAWHSPWGVALRA